MMTRIAIRKKIICLLATYLHQKPKLLSYPQEVEEIKEKEDEVSSEIPIDTIVMPIRTTFDNPIDFNNHFSKPKDFKTDITILFASSESSILPSPLLDSDSPFTAELSASVTLNSLENEEKVFKPGLLVYHAIHDNKLVTLEENLKENISSGSSSTTTAPIVEKIDKLERLIIDGKLTLMGDEGKPLEKVDCLGDNDSEDEVEPVDNEMASFLASKRIGYGTNSFLEQWRETSEC
ncbi:hypothetical protein Tco_1185254 [Tanacetum coccineum]